MRLFVFFVAGILVIHPCVMAADVYLDGDFYVIDDAVFENDAVHVGYNQDAWVNLVDNGRVGWISACGSHIDMQGGSIVHDLSLRDYAVGYISGGVIGGMLEVVDNGIMRLYGKEFRVTDLNGVTTPLKPGDSLREFASLVSEEGQPPYYTGTITGTLVYGSVLNNTFRIYGGHIIVHRFMASGPKVLALSQEQGTGLFMRKNSVLTVATDGHPLAAELVVINASGRDALRIQGTASIATDGLWVVGGLNIKGTLSHPDDMGISENMGEVGIIPDFFEELQEPDYSDLPDLCPLDSRTGLSLPLHISGGQSVLWPGYYSAGIIVEQAAVTLMPGIYHLGGGTKGYSGLILKHGAVVDANDVMFHIVRSGKVFVDNDAVLAAKASTTDPHQDFLFFQSRQNANPAVFNGTLDCSGTFYFPANHIQIAGRMVCTSLLANTIEVSTDAELVVNLAIHSSD